MNFYFAMNVRILWSIEFAHTYGWLFLSCSVPYDNSSCEENYRPAELPSIGDILHYLLTDQAKQNEQHFNQNLNSGSNNENHVAVSVSDKHPSYPKTVELNSPRCFGKCVYAGSHKDRKMIWFINYVMNAHTHTHTHTNICVCVCVCVCLDALTIDEEKNSIYLRLSHLKR